MVSCLQFVEEHYYVLDRSEITPAILLTSSACLGLAPEWISAFAIPMASSLIGSIARDKAD
jgi:hypothetical protein